MKGFAELESLFKNFPNQWFGVATARKYCGASAKQTSGMLAIMVEHKFLEKSKRPKLHAQAFFYRLHKAHRAKMELQNHAQNHTISSGEVSPLEMQGVQSEPYYIDRVSDE